MNVPKESTDPYRESLQLQSFGAPSRTAGIPLFFAWAKNTAFRRREFRACTPDAESFGTVLFFFRNFAATVSTAELFGRPGKYGVVDQLSFGSAQWQLQKVN